MISLLFLQYKNLKKNLAYLDYLQKQVNKLVRGQEIPLGTIDQMLFMINELKKE